MTIGLNQRSFLLHKAIESLKEFPPDSKNSEALWTATENMDRQDYSMVLAMLYKGNNDEARGYLLNLIKPNQTSL